MGSVPTARRRRRVQLLQVSFVLFALFAAGLVSAGVVSGAGPLAALSDSTSTETTETSSESTVTETTIDTETTATSTETSTTPPPPTSPIGPPVISSDQEDYAPGDLATLTGSGWVPGETVAIDVNDDQGQTWRRTVSVVADTSGAIIDRFNLPDWFVAVYRVTATGPVSGVATTTFTDANYRFLSSGPTLTGISWQLYSNATCTSALSGPGSSGTASITTTDTSAGTLNVAAVDNEWIGLTAPATAGGQSFVSWAGTSGGPNFTTSGPGNRAICVEGENASGLRRLTATYATPSNTAPTAANVSDSTNEDTPKAITLSASDAQQCELTFSIVSGPTNGTLGSIANNACASGSPNTDTASVTYTPNANFSGSDSFTYKVNDGALDSNTATVSITVNAVDDAPTAVDDSATVNEDSGANAIDVLANDTDPDGGTKSIQSVTQPANGTVAITGGGTGLTYAPNANYCNGGSPTDNFSYTLDGGSTATVSVSVTCVDDPPVIAFTSGSTGLDEGANETYVFSITDPDSTSFTYEAGYPKCGVGGAVVGTPTLGPTSGSFQCTFADGPASPTVAAQIRDATSASNEVTRGVSVANVDPTVTVSGDAGVDEGQTRTYAIATSDPGQETFTLTAHSCGTGGSEVSGSLTFNPATGAGSFQCTFPDGPASPSVSATVSDGDGGSGSDSISVTVGNVAPVITSMTGPSAPVALGGPASVTTTYTDVGAQDTHMCTYTWDDGSPPTTVAGSGSGTGSCTGTHTYSSAGVYSVGVTVTDDDTGSATSQYEFVVVFDPSAGFVTGGGWINSPAGAYTAGPALTGRANFGFVSKYKKGANVPEGQTEFQLHFATFNFHSTAYQWLVVSANGTKAQYKGDGKLNGGGNYGFLLTAYDGSPDSFRIKIWDKATSAVVYDNRVGAPEDIDAADPQEIAGGSIVIHRGK
jgi:hypothetical protein